MVLRSVCLLSGTATRSLLDESMKRLEARADEMLNKLGRLDRMLDHVVDGSADCPRLFILTPATGSNKVREQLLLIGGRSDKMPEHVHVLPYW